MTEATAKVHISLVEGILQIEGSEKFVSEQIARLEPHIIRAFENRELPKKSNKSSEAVGTSNQTSSLENYSNLFAKNGEKIQILKPIPGKNNAEKTVNIALLLLYANNLLGATVLSGKVISESCKSHACLDAPNFSSTLKDKKNYFLLEGTGRQSKNVSLTEPGKKKAEELAKQLSAS